MNNHQNIWNAIDVIAQTAGLTASGLAKAAGLNATSFNQSKRIGPTGRQHWPSTETIQRVLDATNTTWSEFGHLVEAGLSASQSDEGPASV